MADPDPDPSPSERVRFALDVRAEREAAGLRIAAALLVLPASVWLLALPYPFLRLFALSGFAFAGLWIVRALRARRLTRAQAEHYLELDRDALRLREGERLQVLPWKEVESVRVDEDRLTVSLARRDGGPPLELEPRYQGLGVHDLGQAVYQALARARARAGGGPG